MLCPGQENIARPKDVIDQFQNETNIIRVMIKQELQKLKNTANFVLIFGCGK